MSRMMVHNADTLQRRVIKVCCPLCGAFIRRMVTDCLRVTETCRTCVYGEAARGR
ncbi:MAG: hypothetical protein WC600_17095 [Desulfobaccales bacterium]